MCGADLDVLGKRPGALVCSPAHRAEKSKRLAAGLPVATQPHSKRTSPRKPRTHRPGVTVYIANPAAASLAADILSDTAYDQAQAVAASIRKALARKKETTP